MELNFCSLWSWLWGGYTWRNVQVLRGGKFYYDSNKFTNCTRTTRKSRFLCKIWVLWISQCKLCYYTSISTLT